MIAFKITNSSEVVASKAGKIFEKLTPEKIDQNLVEFQLVQQLIEQLSIEGLKGEIFVLNGIDIDSNHLIVEKGFAVKEVKKFPPQS